MRILIATNGYPAKKNPTRQVFVKNIFYELRNLNIETDVVFNQWFRHFRSDLGTGSFVTSAFRVLAMALSYAPWFFYRARKYSVIYSQGSVLPGIFVALSKPFHHAKHAGYAHGSEEEYLLKKGILFNISRFVLNRCDLVATNSRYMQNLLKKEYGCESVIIHPGYNHHVFCYEPGPKNIDIFFTGHAIERKGIGLLMKAISENREFYSAGNVSIHIHFSGGMEQHYHRLAKESGIDTLITFGGRLDEHVLVEHYRRSKIVVLPSVREPLGLVGIEAIACGAFLVASDTGGIKEYVQDGVNGLLFENGNHHDLHKKIVQALECYPSIEARQPEIARTVESFSVSESAKQTAAHFQKLRHE